MRLALTDPRSRGWLVTEQGLELRTLVETLFFLLQAHIFLTRTFWQLCGQAGPLLCGREQLEAPGVNSVAWQCGLVGDMGTEGGGTALAGFGEGRECDSEPPLSALQLGRRLTSATIRSCT